MYQRVEGAPTYRRGFEPRRFNPMRSGYQPRNVCTLKLRSSSRALVVVQSKPAQLAHLPEQRRQPSFFIPHLQLLSTLSQYCHASSIAHRRLHFQSTPQSNTTRFHFSLWFASLVCEFCQLRLPASFASFVCQLRSPASFASFVCQLQLRVSFASLVCE